MSTTTDIAQAYAANPELKARAEQEMGRLLARSATDAAFRQKLLTDPRAAVEEFTGRPVSEGFNVRFVENKADATIVLPDAIDPAAELSDQELEAVAGGSTLGCVATALWVAAELVEIFGD